ncbi:lysM domain receptor-like kinase 3 [Ricinus communis]|uniref:Protein kinase APK1A, chloroplast, putative n=1 Tax=Ricinus communis TaxID=3988 RepID=B9SY61_RICCO|nr:lysM domain receptor-like kinase 3 [Ricinus communis]EEF31445.1 Protein kinase APK1A, chloroplast precursor, putative [Ricinus communis]|eukprot:XP_002530930.1 lysM domain receptor-like kinase 3 [Ricinus communis]
MCRSKRSTSIIQSLSPKSHHSSFANPSSSTSLSSSSTNYPGNNYPSSSSCSSSYTNNHYKNTSKSSSFSNKPSLKSLKASLPENPNIYNFSEISKATNNFLSKPFSSSSSATSWRCHIRNKEVVLVQRKLRRDPIELPELQQRLSTICRTHHSSLIKLLGASTSGSYVYLVYEYIHGANLSTCLRNPQNPNYTVLSNWVSRMQIATDIAHGLDYIHHCTDQDSVFVHNHIKSSSVIVSEDSLNAKICHFGTAELCGEMEKLEAKSLTRSSSKGMKIEGTRGYMAPEFQASGVVTQKSDVYAFGVVVLELVSGEEALRYVFDEGSGGFRRVSVIEGAKNAVASGGSGVRSWVDRRLRDSYPVEVAEKMVLVGLECVEEQPEKRPDMEQVATRVSKLYLESKNWAEKIGVPIDFSVSMAPR